MLDRQQRRAVAARGRALAEEWHVPVLDVAGALDWLRDRQRSIYLMDVRTAEEFAAGHAPGAQHAPGGQLVQATDQWLGVRGGRVLLLDDVVIRAASTARWLRLMGWEAAILPGGAETWMALDWQATPIAADHLPEFPHLSYAAIGDAAVLDLRSSQAYRQGHIAGAIWAIRPRLPRVLAGLPQDARVMLATPEPDVARAFAADLPADILARTALLAGDVADWCADGAEIVASPDAPEDIDCIDYLFFVHDRHAGNLQAAQQYLDWETGLAAQLDQLELGSFRLPSPADPPRA